ANFVTKLF
ncbi:hypothetical protein MPH_05283, partial [Macrophomina phaseolina MS6]